MKMPCDEKPRPNLRGDNVETIDDLVLAVFHEREKVPHQVQRANCNNSMFQTPNLNADVSHSFSY